ncbi:hypothetical protein [Variovorax terrae]|uniref:DUF2783 domain-containing protein n=1 Tax=Variovorax terrae TaxID=2923278 RepID=A0A9X1VZT3_9BURK|nr:hypothetical protein [Variovorax terrae]MCJ0763478.1 hypothetical protein [Variovorax terrae]
MTDHDLDRCYTALCETLAQVGPAQAPLFLSMACLSLMSRFERAEEVLPLLAHAHRQCAAEGAADGPPVR